MSLKRDVHPMGSCEYKIYANVTNYISEKNVKGKEGNESKGIANGMLSSNFGYTLIALDFVLHYRLAFAETNELERGKEKRKLERGGRGSEKESVTNSQVHETMAKWKNYW